jgi:hypothetical protein
MRSGHAASRSMPWMYLGATLVLRHRESQSRPQRVGLIVAGGDGHGHPSICLEGRAGRRAAGGGAEPPASGGATGPHATPQACGLRRSSGAAVGPTAAPPGASLILKALRDSGVRPLPRGHTLRVAALAWGPSRPGAWTRAAVSRKRRKASAQLHEAGPGCPPPSGRCGRSRPPARRHRGCAVELSATEDPG